MKTLLRASVVAAVALVAGFSYDDVDPAKIERIQDAAFELRARGATVSQIETRLNALGVAPEKMLEIIHRSAGYRDRDPRSRRSVSIYMVTTDANATQATADIASAWCAPLDGMPQHATCVADQAGWFNGDLCSSGNVHRARWAAIVVKPSEAKRIADAAALNRFEERRTDRAGFDARIGTLGLSICRSAPTP